MDELSPLAFIIHAVILFSLSMYPVGLLFSCSECCGPPDPPTGECRCLRFERRTKPSPSIYFEDALPIHGWSSDAINPSESGLVSRCESVPISRSVNVIFSSGALFRPDGTRTTADALSDGETASTIPMELWSRYVPALGLAANPNRFPPLGTDSIILEKVTDVSCVFQGTTQKLSVSNRLLPTLYLDGNVPASVSITLKTVIKGTASVTDAGPSVNVPASAALVGAGLDPFYSDFRSYLDGNVLTPQSLLAMGSVSNDTQTELLANGSTRVTYSATFTFTPNSSLFAYVPVGTSSVPFFFGAFYLIEVTHGSFVQHFTVQVRGSNENAPLPLPEGGLPPVNIPNLVVPPQPGDVAGSVVSTEYSGTSATLTMKTRTSASVSFGPSPVPLDQIMYTPAGRNRLQNSFVWSVSPGVYTTSNPLTPRITLTPQACVADKFIWSAAAGPTATVFAVGGIPGGLTGNITPQGIEENIVFDYDQVDEFAAGSRQFSYLSVDAGIIDVTRAAASPLCGRWFCSAVNNFGGTEFQDHAVPQALDEALPSTATVSVPAGESLAYTNLFGCESAANAFGLKRYGSCWLMGETTGGAEPNPAAALRIKASLFFCGDSLWAIDNGPCISTREYRDSAEIFDPPYGITRSFVPQGSTVSLGGDLPEASEACFVPVRGNLFNPLFVPGELYHWAAIQAECPPIEATATVTAQVAGYCDFYPESTTQIPFDGQSLVAELNTDVVMPLVLADRYETNYSFRYAGPAETNAVWISGADYQTRNLNTVPCQTGRPKSTVFGVTATERRSTDEGAASRFVAVGSSGRQADCFPNSPVAQNGVYGVHRSIEDWPESIPSPRFRDDSVEGTFSIAFGSVPASVKPAVAPLTSEIPAEQTEITQTITGFTEYTRTNQENSIIIATDNGPHVRTTPVEKSLFPDPAVAYVYPSGIGSSLDGDGTYSLYRTFFYPGFVFTKANRPAWSVNNIRDYTFLRTNPFSVSRGASSLNVTASPFWSLSSTNGMDLISESDWITVGAASRSFPSYDKIWPIQFQANNTGAARSGSLLFTYGGFSERWVINQPA